jgi:hypothetical protein
MMEGSGSRRLIDIRILQIRIRIRTHNTDMQNVIKITVNHPKFGNGPLVRHPLSEILKNHITAGTEVSNLAQKAERLHIFSGPIQNLIIGGLH